MANALIQPGAKVAGKYRIIRPLGEGGMGMVYMATHELLDRTVAIKVLHARLEHRELAVKRFQREIKAMALVQNPYIAQAVDAGVLENGALYLAMEYLDGRNLRAELKLRRAIPYPEAVAYVMQACAGVGAVHDVSIIHRDLKPQNLFLTALQGARCIKVLDFGIAKFIDSPDVGMTDSQVAVGTPLYMAPEQLTRPEDVSRRTDVWGLAVVLYELIAGVSPFAASTPGAVVAAVVLQEPVPLCSAVPEVPKALARVVAKALSKSPAQRTNGVKELAAELAPFGMPLDRIIVPRPTWSSRAVPTLQRVSSRPELAVCIEREVEAFEPDGGASSSGDAAHVLRELPSLAKLSIPPTESEPLLESLYLGETAEQPTVASAAVPGVEPRISSQPTTMLRTAPRASEPLFAVGPRSKVDVRHRLIVVLGFLVLCAAAGAALIQWPRASSITASPVQSAQRERVSGSDRLVVNDIAPPMNASQPSGAPAAEDRAPGRSLATGSGSSSSASEPRVERRATKIRRPSAATPLVRPPTTAASSAPDGKPLHL